MNDLRQDCIRLVQKRLTEKILDPFDFCRDDILLELEGAFGQTVKLFKGTLLLRSRRFCFGSSKTHPTDERRCF